MGGGGTSQDLAGLCHDGMFDITPAVLCLLVALFAQIASNFANDYFDFKKGADREDRLGPERAVAQGWITPKAMLTGTFAMLGLACLSGLLLICFADWRLIWVGLAIAICVLAYSAGPFPLAYNGLGDVCVLLFYGVIPVCFTYYIQMLSFSLLSIITGTTCRIRLPANGRQSFCSVAVSVGCFIF